MIKRKIIFLVILTGSILSCSKHEAETAEADVVVKENEIVLSPQQLEAAQIRTGSITRATVTRELALNGVIELPPQNLITVSPPSDGFVRDIRVREGMKVRKGDLLLTLENMAFIQLQQDYLENRSRLEFLSAEYERQKVLANENINSGKILQQAKADYEGTLSMVRGLEARMKMLRIDVDKVAGGEITSRVKVFAPTDGFVTGVVEGSGHFVQTTEALMRIIDVDQVQLVLQVFEKDIASVSPGQAVEFMLANDTTRHQATVYLVGKELTDERTVRVLCRIAANNNVFMPGMYVTARLVIASHEGDVLPVESVIRWGSHQGIFVAEDGNRFRLIEISTGSVKGPFIEVRLPRDFDQRSAVVTGGAQHLLGILKNNPED